jgi:hypothetical protein
MDLVAEAPVENLGSGGADDNEWEDIDDEDMS